MQHLQRLIRTQASRPISSGSIVAKQTRCHFQLHSGGQINRIGNPLHPHFPPPQTPCHYAPPPVLISVAFANKMPKRHTISEQESLQLALEQETELRRLDNIQTHQLLALEQSLKTTHPTLVPSVPVYHRDGVQVSLDEHGDTPELKELLASLQKKQKNLIQDLKSDPNAPVGYDVNDRRFTEMYDAQEALRAQYDDEALAFHRLYHSLNEDSGLFQDESNPLLGLLSSSHPKAHRDRVYSKEEMAKLEAEAALKMRILKIIRQESQGLQIDPSYEDLVAAQYLRDLFVAEGKMGANEPFLGLLPEQLDQLADAVGQKEADEEFISQQLEERFQRYKKAENPLVPGVFSIGVDTLKGLSSDEFDRLIFGNEGRRELDEATATEMEKQWGQIQKQKAVESRQMGLVLKQLEAKHGPLGPEPDRNKNPGLWADWKRLQGVYDEALRKAQRTLRLNSPSHRAELSARRKTDWRLRDEVEKYRAREQARKEALWFWNNSTEEERILFERQLDDAVQIKQRAIQRDGKRVKRLLLDTKVELKKRREEGKRSASLQQEQGPNDPNSHNLNNQPIDQSDAQKASAPAVSTGGFFSRWFD